MLPKMLSAVFLFIEGSSFFASARTFSSATHQMQEMVDVFKVGLMSAKKTRKWKAKFH
jgi:hypothetical protein